MSIEQDLLPAVSLYASDNVGLMATCYPVTVIAHLKAPAAHKSARYTTRDFLIRQRVRKSVVNSRKSVRVSLLVTPRVQYVYTSRK